MAGKLGVLVAQFPASFRDAAPNRAHLATLLRAFSDHTLAVELRHCSWSAAAEDTWRLLDAFGATWAWIDEPRFKDRGPHPPQLSSGTVRYHGEAVRFDSPARRGSSLGGAMKRVLLTIGAVLLLLVGTVVVTFAVTFMGRREIVDGQAVGKALMVTDGFASIGVVPIGEGQVLLVDAGEDTAAAAILAGLARQGLSADAVRAILITHGHQDHTGGLSAFPKALVMALDAEVPIVEGREGTHGPLTQLFGPGPEGTTVSRRLRDGESFALGSSNVKVYALPGHTRGSAAYLVDDLLFVGDSADVTSDGAMQGAAWLFSDSQPDNRASLVRLAARLADENAPVRAIVPAHSGPVDGLAPLTALVRTE